MISKVSMIVGCELKRIGDLGYDFLQGTCAAYNYPQERILLCFANEKKTGCERYGSLLNMRFNL